MNKRTNFDPAYRTEGALLFLKELKEAVNKGNTFQEVSISVMDHLYDTLACIHNDVSFYVRCEQDLGYESDFLDGLSKEEWDQLVWNGERDFSNMQTYTYEGAQKLFCELLGYQALSNVPHNLEEAKHHLLINIFSVFNGANFLNRKFELIYINYDLFEGHFEETDDLTDLLVIDKNLIAVGI